MADSKKFRVETPTGAVEFDLDKILSAELDPEETKEALKRKLNLLNIKAGEKGLLWSLVDKTIWIGNKLLKIGQKIIEVVVYVVSKFPMTVSGLVLGLTIQMLMQAIPFLGVFLGPVVGSLLTGVLFFGGMILDLKNKIQVLLSGSIHTLKTAFSEA